MVGSEMTGRLPVRIPVDSDSIGGDLTVPQDAQGLVIFAHGSGSGRLSPRNRFVAQILNEADLATLLIDLLTAEEEQIDLHTARLRFDIRLLASRLIAATEWADKRADLHELNKGYFGASTGAAAALVAAAQLSDNIQAVVSRGGRPDLAGPVLSLVRAPTLLIVGGNDYTVIEMNEQAMDQMEIASKQLLIIPEATHLFEEEGALEAVAEAASRWFQKYLGSERQAWTEAR